MSLASTDLQALLALAPTELRNFRTRRYHGDDLAISVESFTPTDQILLERIYRFLVGLFEALRVPGDARAVAFSDYLACRDVGALLQDARKLGAESYRANPSPLLAKTIHDVRGGGLSPLLGLLELRVSLGSDQPPSDSLYFLTRDHLKIMRNALLGLDDPRRNADLEIKLHGTDFFLEKWNGIQLANDRGGVRMEVRCERSVDISECCVEFGALDRILYNLINNASRHSAGETIRLVLFPVPDDRGENLRFVLLNSLSPEDRQHLGQVKLATLFREGVSTTGSGYGLNVAAEFVANAFGLGSPRTAVEGGYLGAELLDDEFAIWFHWPIVADV